MKLSELGSSVPPEVWDSVPNASEMNENWYARAKKAEALLHVIDEAASDGREVHVERLEPDDISVSITDYNGIVATGCAPTLAMAIVKVEEEWRALK